MSTTDWPASITPSAVQWQLLKAGVQFTSPFNGSTQALDYIAERWAVSLSLPAAARPGPVAALLNNLAGGVNRVNLWHPGHQQPAGTLRGSPVLGAGAARGDATLTLAGCTNANLIAGGGFEIDTNADGISDGFSAYSAGTTGALSYFRPAGPLYAGCSGAYQQVSAATLNGNVGFFRAVPAVAGSAYTASFDMASSVGNTLHLDIYWYNGGGSLISSSAASFSGASDGRRSVTGVAPSGTANAVVYVYLESTAGVAATLAIDQMQWEQAAAATDYAGPATLLAGDFVGCSGHLFQIAADCTATDAGVMTVTLVNRVRATIAISTAVTWYRPTAQFVMPAMQGGALQVPGMLQSAALDLLEVY